VLQFALLALAQEFCYQLSSVLEVSESALLLLVRVFALGLQVEQGFIEGAVFFIESVVVVALLEETLPLPLEVLLGDLGLLLLDSLLPLEVLLCNGWILLQPGLVVLLRGLYLVLDILLPASAKSFEFSVNFLLL
jgi:hypothetical protein